MLLRDSGLAQGIIPRGPKAPAERIEEAGKEKVKIKRRGIYLIVDTEFLRGKRSDAKVDYKRVDRHKANLRNLWKLCKT